MSISDLIPGTPKVRRSEMFQPQSFKGWAMEEKGPGCLHLTLFHFTFFNTTLITWVRQDAFWTMSSKNYYDREKMNLAKGQ